MKFNIRAKTINMRKINLKILYKEHYKIFYPSQLLVQPPKQILLALLLATTAAGPFHP